jgi:hypothetical protein
MNLIRSHIASRIVTIFVGAIFLNMSFLLSEIRMLRLDVDNGLAHNIAKLVSGAGFEEEREGGEESSSSEGKIVDIFLMLGASAPRIAGIVIPKSKIHVDDRSLSPGCVEITTPPPKV